MPRLMQAEYANSMRDLWGIVLRAGWRTVVNGTALRLSRTYTDRQLAFDACQKVGN